MKRLSPQTAMLLTLPPLLWAGNAVLGRMLIHSIAPFMLNALRWSLALLILLPLARKLWQRPAMLRTHGLYLAKLGILGMGCYNALQYLALHSATALNVTLIAASLPVWMLLIGALFFRARARRPQVLGALVSLIGVCLVVSQGQVSRLAGLHFVIGDVLMLAAVASWALYSWLLAHPPAPWRQACRPDWDWADLLVAQTLFGLVFAWTTAGLEHAIAPQPTDWSWTLLLGLAYVALGPSVIAYRCWAQGVQAVGPTVAGFFGNLTPIFAALLSSSLLGEPPHWYHGAAFVLIVAGILMSSWRSGSPSG